MPYTRRPPQINRGSTEAYWGARIDGQFYADNYAAPDNLDAPWSGPVVGDSWDLFEAHAGGKKVSFIHWGGSGVSIIAFDTTANGYCHARGAFSSYTMGASTEQITDIAANSNAHGHITTVQTWATAAASQGWPILLRPWWEMNGNWGYPWQTAAGITSGTYVSAWQNLHTLITAIASNVSFFWCPNVKSPTVPDPSAWYPGSAYVDWLGFDGYCYGTYQSPAAVFDETYDICIALGSSKPFGLGETGCEAPTTSPGKAAWITDLYSNWIPSRPNMKLVSWFNEAGGVLLPHMEVGDAAITFGGAAQTAFAAAVADNYYFANVAATFPSNAKIPVP